MAEESKSQASRVASEVAPTEQNSANLNDQGQAFGSYQQGGQYQGQFGGQGGKKCMCNPCKCCCGGNLRSACFAISIAELAIAAWLLFSLIWAMVSLNSNTAYKSTSNDTSFATLPLVFEIIFILIIVGAGVSLLLAVLKRFKWACIVHAVFILIVTGFMVLGAILCIIVLALISNESCDSNSYTRSISRSISRTISRSSYSKEAECKNTKSVLLGAISGALILFLLLGALCAYFASNSIALYCHYKNGMTYEGTPLCSCCGRGGNQMQPQYQYQYQDQNQNQYQLQYAQPQSRSQMQSQKSAPSYK